MATAAQHLRPSTHRTSRDARAALIGLLAVPIIVIALLIGTVAAAIPLRNDPAAHPIPWYELDH
jgi:hypothetical protein